MLLSIAGLLPRAGVAQTGPAVCTIGMSIESLYDLDMAGDAFGAALWIWTLCPKSLPTQPLETIEFPTADSLARETMEVSATGDGRTYASQRVQGTFRFNWVVDAYPFDRQNVVIPVDETEYGADSLVFAPDTAGSFLSRDARAALSEWKVSDLTITTRVVESETSYGVPGAQNPRFARAEALFVLDRTSLVPFLKLTSGMLAAAFIAFFSFFYDPNDRGTFGGRLGLLIGVLFAVIVNMHSADSALGDIGDVTLVTLLHIITLGYIMLLALLALQDRMRVEAGATLPHPHWRRLSLIGLSYVLVSVLLVARAMLA